MIVTAAYLYGLAVGAWSFSFPHAVLCVTLDYAWASAVSPDNLT